jgi:hypothetical protein
VLLMLMLLQYIGILLAAQNVVQRTPHGVKTLPLAPLEFKFALPLNLMYNMLCNNITMWLLAGPLPRAGD